ncbi:hypothetical protein ACE198_00105 [Neobacillus sp. KR4-4]|uniref:hypothetical protein n=1 Tax=Neobacillus sp. KR4-4 TaxID=3344872 RepID=UPI0035CC632A
MVLFFYIVLNLLALFLFIRKKKMLHILEVIVYWAVSSYLYQNFSALCYMNFKTLTIPENLSYEFSHVINRIILFPILMVTFLHFFLILTTLLRKLLLMISFIILLTGMEYLADYLGVIKHVHWQIWWSLSIWMFDLCVLIVFMQWFRRILYKGDWYE